MAGDFVPDPEFAKRLARFRGKRAQQQIADEAGLAQSKYSELESAKRTPRLSPREVVALSKALGVGVLELLGVEESDAATRRLSPIESYVDDLEDSDIEALALTAKQLASRRREPGPDYPHLPGWDRLNERQQNAIREAVRIRDRAGWQRVAEESAQYDEGSDERGGAGGSGPRGGTGA